MQKLISDDNDNNECDVNNMGIVGDDDNDNDK